MIAALDKMSVCLGRMKLVASPGTSVPSRGNAATHEVRTQIITTWNRKSDQIKENSSK